MRNASRYLDRCVESLLQQTYPTGSYEIIIVNNNSTDGSAGLIAKYPPVRLLSETTQGSYAARNRGVKAARGEILAFTDSDCAPAKDWITNIVRPFASPAVKVVQGRRVFADDSRILSVLAAYEAEHAAYSLSPEGMGTHFGYTNNMAVRRETFERCGPFLAIARGADSVFVDRVVGEFSIDAIRFARDAVIRHLEMTGLARWLMKRLIRGRSLQRTRRLRSYRRAAPKKMPLILRRTIENGNYSAVDRAILLMLIAMGTLAFDLGRISCGWKSLKGKSPSTNEDQPIASR
jgi:glycosyltransferase involved in cell wall biosynthesis